MHQGLPTHLQFGTHSTTGIFQRKMDRMLERLLFAKVQVDNILISGKTDLEHLNNLFIKQCFENLEGIRTDPESAHLCSLKLYFVVSSSAKKVANPQHKTWKQNVLNVPRPTKVIELRAFLGMTNYYNAYIPRMAFITEPLHNLLRKNVIWK